MSLSFPVFKPSLIPNVAGVSGTEFVLLSTVRLKSHEKVKSHPSGCGILKVYLVLMWGRYRSPKTGVPPCVFVPMHGEPACSLLSSLKHTLLPA